MDRIPTSIYVLLSALKKLIAVDVQINKSIMWQLIKKTIDKHEFKSNFVYSVVQHLFDVVDVNCEEVYSVLKAERIHIAPKLLMNIRRERKRKQMMKATSQVSNTHIYCYLLLLLSLCPYLFHLFCLLCLLLIIECNFLQNKNIHSVEERRTRKV